MRPAGAGVRKCAQAGMRDRHRDVARAQRKACRLCLLGPVEAEQREPRGAADRAERPDRFRRPR